MKANPLNCISSATNLDQCIYRATVAPTPLEVFYASAARPGTVWTLDLGRVICPRLPLCDPVVNGTIVKRDSDHITIKFAHDIATTVDTLLHQAGVLSG